MSRHAVVVLMVEDEVLIRMDIADVITNAGFEVVEAPNAEAALNIFTARPDIKVLLTDVHMPGQMDGMELARTVRQRVPKMGIIVMSGRAEPKADELPDGVTFLSKPIDDRVLVKALNDLAA